MLRMLVLLAICAAAAVGIAYWSGYILAADTVDVTEEAATHGSDHGDAPVNLVVTTHNPPCTAIFMHNRDEVVLRTELRPIRGYTQTERVNGVDLTYAVPAHRAGELLSALSERREVSVAATYSTSESPVPLASVTGSDLPGEAINERTTCSIYFESSLHRIIYDTVLPDSRSAASGETMWVNIRTSSSNAEALAFLRQHGIETQDVDEPRPTRVGGMGAVVPVSLLAQLSQVDNVLAIEQMPVIKIP